MLALASAILIIDTQGNLSSFNRARFIIKKKDYSY